MFFNKEKLLSHDNATAPITIVIEREIWAYSLEMLMPSCRVPKLRRQVVYGGLRRDVGPILRRLCELKAVGLLEGKPV